MNGSERILSRIAGKPVDRLPFMPITMQFAAAQIGARYCDYATDYRVLVQGQLRTAELFDLDYVNTMSDPAREAADCGAAVEYFDNQPPALDEENALLSDRSKLLELTMPDPLRGGRMHNGVRAIAELRQRVGNDKLVEGWIEGPCAEAADLRGINSLMLDFYDDPQFVRDLFEWVVEMELRFARAQAEAGADMIGIGDAAASLVGPELYKEFVWPYERKLVEGVRALGVHARLHICGNTRFCLKEMGELGCAIVDLDFLSPLAEARAAMRADQVLLGNIEPVAVLRDATRDNVFNAVAQCHREAGARFIVGAGCEVPSDTPSENLRAMLDYARSAR